MNERIKELAEQAKEYADTKYSKLVSASRWGDSVPGIRELYTEKFAELIVKECAELIDNKVMITAAQTYDDVFVAVYDTNFANAKRIREHFGVEQ